MAQGRFEFEPFFCFHAHTLIRGLRSDTLSLFAQAAERRTSMTMAERVGFETWLLVIATYCQHLPTRRLITHYRYLCLAYSWVRVYAHAQYPSTCLIEARFVSCVLRIRSLYPMFDPDHDEAAADSTRSSTYLDTGSCLNPRTVRRLATALIHFHDCLSRRRSVSFKRIRSSS